MIDFSKKLKSNKSEKKIEPVEIYQELDRKSDTGPLRKIQEEILSAKQATKTLGKGYNYPVSGHFIALDGALRGESKKLFGLAGY